MRGRVFLVTAAAFLSVHALWAKTPPPGLPPSTHLEQKRVLILHSDNPFLPANMLMDQVFLEVLKSSNSINVTIYSEYLELVRFSKPEMQVEGLRLLNARYAALDLVIVTDDFSWDFYEDHAAIFRAAPVVMCGITEGYLGGKTLPKGVTGNFKRVDIGRGLENILRLHPGVKEVFTVTGTSAQDLVYAGIAEKAFADFSDRLRIQVLRDYSLEEIGRLVSALPPDSVILYLTVYRDGAGNSYNPRDALSYLSRFANAPIHGISDTYLGFGILGGNLVSFRDFTKDAAELALAVLSGTDPAVIPAHPFINNNYFDQKELTRWNIREALLPANSIIINRPAGPWQLYRWQILAALLFIALETSLVLGLVYSRLQFKFSLMKLGLSEERFRSAISEAPIPIMISAEDGTVEALSRTWTDITGYSLEEIPTLAKWTQFAYGESGGSVKANIDALFQANSRVEEGEFVIRTKAGEDRTWAFSSAPLGKLVDGKRILISMAKDVTEKNKAEKGLKDSLREKEVLLRELHHRTKNNMNVIISLLNMQSTEAEDPRLRRAFGDAEDRIRAMALVHQMLYDNEDLSRLNLKSYLFDLIHILMDGYDISGDRISVTLDLEDVFVSLDTAIPCGLIINELVSNSLKYAFPGEAKGGIRVGLSRRPGGAILIEVSDDGVGLPAGFDPRRDGSMGMKIFFSLAETQLRAAVSCASGKGLGYTILFSET